MLQRIYIEGLFEAHTHELALHAEEPVLLLHGENGVGKSTLLESISFTLNQNWPGLARLPFDRLTLQWEEAELRVERRIPVRSKPLEGTLALTLTQGEEVRELELPLGPLWSHTDSEGPLPEAGWLNQFCEQHPVLLLGSNRLSGPPGSAVQQCATEMRQRLTAILDQLLNESLAQDFRFLSTLDALPEEVDPERLQQRLDELRDLLEELARLGLIDPMDLPPELPRLPPEQRPLVLVYVEQQLAKLESLQTLRDQIRQLLRLLHRRLRLKQVRIDRRLGYAVLLASGQLLPLDRLSSGEQHLIVLLHRLLFETTPQTLVLLDEPELSWHVEWQYSFMDDLLRLAELTGGQFLIATHSPQIVGNHWDRTLEITV